MHRSSIQIFSIYVFSKYPFRNCIHSVIPQRLCSGSNSSNQEKSTWKSVVGLEIHAQINAKSKLFSNSASFFNVPTNTQVSYFDAALPGCLPVLNKYCVEAGILTALALNCNVNKKSMFDRKHYFYPDLPAGYQITQQFYPLANNGYLKFHVYEDAQKKTSFYDCGAHLKQLQLEQDSGRSFHIDGQRSLVDLNRAGIGLMELVFEPDLKNGREAAALVQELILILRCIGVCTCNMEEGAFRVDANISVNRVGEPLGVRTEVKNINSSRYISKAIDYEIDRQIKIIEDGGLVSNETRRYDYNLKKTIFMRDKETLQDYRFMPEPNLPPITLLDDGDADVSESSDFINIDRLKEKLPVLPNDQRLKIMSEFDITYDIADKLVSEEGIKTLFYEIATHVTDKTILANFLLSNIKHQLKLRKLSFINCPVTTNQIAGIVQLFEKNTITEATSNDILEMLFNGDQRSAADIVKEYNWYQILDGEELENLCRQAMAAEPKMVRKYRKSRKKRHLAFLLVALNEISNNRVSRNDAVEVFIRLICKNEEHQAKDCDKKGQDPDNKS